MDVVYFLLFVFGGSGAILIVFRSLYKEPQNFWKFILFVVVLVAGALGMEHSVNMETSAHKGELEAMGFQRVMMWSADTAQVASSASCNVSQLSLSRVKNHWVVNTAGVASKKPILGVQEVLQRPEIKWLCSKPQIKN